MNEHGEREGCFGKRKGDKMSVHCCCVLVHSTGAVSTGRRQRYTTKCISH